MLRAFLPALLTLIFLALPCPAQDKYTLQEKESTPPKEIAAGTARLLSGKSLQVTGGSKMIGEFWIRSTLPTTATPDQIKNGITYREINQGELLGVLRLEKEWTDYRKQRIPAGVYTLRLGYQPQDGDHMGMGEFQDYLLLIDASMDTTAEPLEPATMVKSSIKTLKTGHPGVLMLVPTPAKGKDVEIVARPRNNFVLNVRRELTSAGKKAGPFALGITIEGHAE